MIGAFVRVFGGIKMDEKDKTRVFEIELDNPSNPVVSLNFDVLKGLCDKSEFDPDNGVLVCTYGESHECFFEECPVIEC